MPQRPTLTHAFPPRLEGEAASHIQGASHASILVLSAGGEVAYGFRLCATGKPSDSIPALTLPLAAKDVAALRAADRESCPWDTLADAAVVLDRHQVRRVLIASVLGRSAIEITRLIQYVGLHPAARAAVASGALTPAHVRSLASTPRDAQPAWISKAIANQWSTRKLQAELRGEAAGELGQDRGANADMASYERSLSESLGTNVAVMWPEAPAKRRLSVDWYGVEDLKGILAKLAKGPESESDAPQVKRQLIIEVQDAAELSSLTDHLIVSA